ncbi:MULTISPECIES: exopolysaccharide transport family protein [unclassified Mesorhizobium]|uniref:GumC family protein n=1 Tax=unclassified Mesorhizobium TaxID=325217 RepID=UPI000FD77C8C|nr:MULTISPECIES: exopolysaccharide transport family protein [unclassified Mesorhizobium]TGQ11519.1 hypothetical protein EN862_011160 [Mesorhizobium sp. M2E.F.Ca.ET.219.01.1.1]TGT63015.1 hypothetical protein EN809_037065 [Mesorhizobium sp. M2E.F.Ca.ET.166.01.1.1]TGV96638.1 hypothetical protein EN797_037045 [Mesorhizobium sp. M2E.F.Ca.ET.154.01.1.1]
MINENPIAETSREATFSDLLAILRKRTRTIITTMLVITMASAAFAIWRGPSYTATVLVVVDPNKSITGAPVETQSPTPDPSLMQTQVNTVLGNPLANQTIDALDLLNDPEFQISAHGRFLARSSSKDEEESATEELRGYALYIFQRNLAVSNPPESRVIQISFTSIDPGKAAAIANQLANFYVANLLDRRNADISAWRARALKSLDAQKGQVIEAEGRVADLRAKGQILTSSNVTLANSDMQELNKLLIESKADEANLRSKLSAIDQIKLSGGSTNAINEVLASQAVSQLRTQELDLMRQIAENSAIYNDHNPRTAILNGHLADVRQRISQEIDRIVTGVRNELAAVTARSAAFEEQLKGAADQNGRAEIYSVQLQVAERDAVARRSVYEDLLRSEQQADAMLGSADAGAWVMSPAEIPIKPSSLSVFIIAAAAGVLSTLLGAAIALARESLDKRLVGSREVEEALGVPCLALLPKPDRIAGQIRHRSALARKANSLYAHAVGALEARLAVASPRARTIVVTSPLPSREKAQLAVDLAVYSAQAGRRTVLVNFDKYQPVPMRDFGLQVPAEATKLLSSNLSSDTSIDVALTLDQATGLDILSLDGEPQSDAHVSAPHNNIVTLIKMLAKRYKYIIVNAPPLLGVSDCHALASHGDCVLIALEWGRTERSDAEAGAGVLRRLTTRLVFAVMTGVEIRGQQVQSSGLLTQKRFRRLYEG